MDKNAFQLKADHPRALYCHCIHERDTVIVEFDLACMLYKFAVNF